jgi:hypothetical protein
MAIIMVSLETGQTPFVITHSKMFKPLIMDETLLVGELGEVMDAPTVRTFHCPVPISGVFALSTKLELQSVMSEPAFAGVGIESEYIITVSVEVGQTPLDIVQIKTEGVPFNESKFEFTSDESCN